MKKSNILCVVILVMSLLIGVGFFVLNSGMPEEGKVSLSPVDFFKGDAKILKEHINWHADCVNIMYKGPKQFLGVTTEVWKQGEIISTGTSFRRFERDLNANFSFSIKKLKDDTYEYIKVLEGNGSSITQIYFEKPHKELNLYNKRLEEKIIIDDTGIVPIWGYFWNDQDNGQYIDYSKSITEQAKDVTGGIVIKLSIVDRAIAEK